MVAYKSTSVERFLKGPDPDCQAVLLYGPDAGLVTLRAEALSAHFAGMQKETAEMVRLDDRDLAEDPGRLEIELRTRPLFAVNRVVRMAAGPRLDVPALKELLQSPLEAKLIVEAGNLRPDSALRKLFEKHAQAAALPCYADEASLARLIDTELGRLGLKIDAEAKSYLMARLGADQALSQAEVVKLGLFASGRGSVGLEDIDAIVGDSAEIETEAFVYEVSGGDTKESLRQLARLAAAGTAPSAALAALARHFLQLHHVEAALAMGVARDQALRTLRPRPHFKREANFLADARRWGATRLLAALPKIHEAVKHARLFPELEQDYAERLVLSLHRKAA